MQKRYELKKNTKQDYIPSLLLNIILRGKTESGKIMKLNK